MHSFATGSCVLFYSHINCNFSTISDINLCLESTRLVYYYYYYYYYHHPHYYYYYYYYYYYLGSLLTNQNYIQVEIKCRLKAGNSCYYSVQTLLSSRLLSKNFKIKIYKTIILPVVLYGCET